MKNSFAILLSISALALLFSSCNNDEEGYEKSPYAYIKSFSVNDITSKYTEYKSDGTDTTVVKTLSMASFPFTINHETGNIYNNTPLPYQTDVSKVIMNMSVEGVATMYVESSGSYELFSLSDSIDFTSSRKFRIKSLDDSYQKDYTISINVHQAEPELMVWDKIARIAEVSPAKAVEFNGNMHVFGTKDGKTVVAVTPIDGKVVWEIHEVAGLPLGTDFSALQVLNNVLYVVADGNLYSSVDASSWNVVSQGDNLIAAVGASDADGCLWLASDNSLYRTEDGLSLERVSDLPGQFPLYGISSCSYPLNHNRNIVRYMLIGYATPLMDGVPQVWSKLSSEDAWSRYSHEGNLYPCPALKGLAVLRYDSYLYAFGGNGVVNDEEIGAFSTFFISKDNGIVWRPYDDFYQLLPKDLKGCDSSFVAATDSRNYIWIITSGQEPSVWRGGINRLVVKE